MDSIMSTASWPALRDCHGVFADDSKRFAEQGLQCLWQIAPGRGRKPVYGSERIKAVVDATLQTKPKGQSHWSCRLMARRQGLSKSTISNIWRSHKLKPHRVKTFKLSRDAKFVAKLTDVIALYLNPPGAGAGAVRG